MAEDTTPLDPDAAMTLREARQQMLMRRPWDAADENTIWEISGDYPKGKGTFTRCLAMTAPHFVTGSDEPLFVMISPAMAGEPVSPSWITAARELRLVDAETGEPYEFGGVL